MKILPLFCALVSLVSIASAEDKGGAITSSLPDSSLLNKDELKKLPRLGMTMNQLQSLWGAPLSDSEDEFTWEDVGGIRLELVFSPLYSSRGGFVINPNRSRCRLIRFRYVEGSLKLNDEEALKIAQALLPGFSWKRMISPEELAAAREKAAQPASDPSSVGFLLN